MRARPVSFAISSHSTNDVDRDQAEQAANEDDARAPAPFNWNTLLGGQGFDGRLRFGQSDPGFFAVKFDRGNHFPLPQERHKVPHIAFREGFRDGWRDGDRLAAFQRLDSVLGFFETDSHALPVDFDGLDFFAAPDQIHERIDIRLLRSVERAGELGMAFAQLVAPGGFSWSQNVQRVIESPRRGRLTLATLDSWADRRLLDNVAVAKITFAGHGFDRSLNLRSRFDFRLATRTMHHANFSSEKGPQCLRCKCCDMWIPSTGKNQSPSRDSKEEFAIDSNHCLSDAPAVNDHSIRPRCSRVRLSAENARCLLRRASLLPSIGNR